jgi:hypothetical protein
VSSSPLNKKVVVSKVDLGGVGGTLQSEENEEYPGMIDGNKVRVET